MEQNIKEKVIDVIKDLPDCKVEQILNYIKLIQQQESIDQNLNKNQDPIYEFIGSITHGNLSYNIDKELYGK